MAESGNGKGNAHGHVPSHEANRSMVNELQQTETPTAAELTQEIRTNFVAPPITSLIPHQSSRIPVDTGVSRTLLEYERPFAEPLVPTGFASPWMSSTRPGPSVFQENLHPRYGSVAEIDPLVYQHLPVVVTQPNGELREAVTGRVEATPAEQGPLQIEQSMGQPVISKVPPMSVKSTEFQSTSQKRLRTAGLMPPAPLGAQTLTLPASSRAIDFSPVRPGVMLDDTQQLFQAYVSHVDEIMRAQAEKVRGYEITIDSLEHRLRMSEDQSRRRLIELLQQARLMLLDRMQERLKRY